VSGHQSQFSRFFAQRVEAGPEPEPAWVPPAWFGPPQDELGECVPISLVLARSKQAIVMLR
jgi:hypothetical protein